MHYVAVPPRYTAFTEGPAGLTEVGHSDHQGQARQMARHATRQAAADSPALNYLALLYDQAAYQGKGGIILRIPYSLLK